MPNSIEFAEKYVPILDEIYQTDALTSALDTNSGLVEWLADVKSFKLAKLSMDGLGDYSRQYGYPAGSASFTWETHSPDWERGRMFTIDTLDDEESAGLLFARLAGEFMRTKVIPEVDAYRFANYVAKTPAANLASGALNDGADLIAALRVATNALNDAQVPTTERFLFTTSAIQGVIEDMDTTKSRAVLNRFAQVIEVPQVRFQTAITLQNGSSDGEEAGGYTVGVGEDINFMVLHKPALLQTMKHVAPKIIDPKVNQDLDAWKYGYRAYGIADVQDLKVAGLYVHAAA